MGPRCFPRSCLFWGGFGRIIQPSFSQNFRLSAFIPWIFSLFFTQFLVGIIIYSLKVHTHQWKTCKNIAHPVATQQNLVVGHEVPDKQTRKFTALMNRLPTRYYVKIIATHRHSPLNEGNIMRQPDIEMVEQRSLIDELLFKETCWIN